MWSSCSLTSQKTPIKDKVSTSTGQSDRISGQIITDIARKTVNRKMSSTDEMTHFDHKIK